MCNKGFGIIETIIAMAILIIIAATAGTTTLHSFSTNRLGEENTTATMYAKEGMEALKSIKNQSWTNMETGSTACDGSVENTIDNTGGSWIWGGAGTQSFEKFTRSIIIENVCRDDSGNISPSGTNYDPDIKKVTSRVTWDFSPNRNNQVELVSYVSHFREVIWSDPIEEGSKALSGTQNGMRVKIQGNYAYVIRNDGNPDFVVLDISDTEDPEELGGIALPGAPQDLAVSGDYAYVASNSDWQELQIIDVSSPDNPRVVGTYNAFGRGDARGIYAVGTTVYISMASTYYPEFYIIDASDPDRPTVDGATNLSGNMNQLWVSGDYAFVSGNNNTRELQIVDISDPGSLSTTSYNLPGSINAVSLEGRGNTIAMGRTDGELVLLDVSDPQNPTEEGTFDAQDRINDIDMDLTLPYVFLASNEDSAELQIVNIDDLENPTLVGSLNLSNDLNGIDYDENLNRVIVASDSNSQEVIIFKRD